MIPSNPAPVGDERAKLISKLTAASAIIGNLPELPGYNGSVLIIDDTEAERIAADLDEVCAALSSSTVQQVGAPAGWKLVPVEPTEAMRAAPSKDRAGFSGQVACEVYQSMLAAAPSPKSEQGDQQ